MMGFLSTAWTTLQTPAYRRHHFTVAVIACVSGLAATFVQLASEIAEGETLKFDTSILRAVRRADDLAIPLGPAWLQTAFIDLTALGSVTVLTLVTLLVVAFLWSGRKPWPAFFITMAIAGGAALSTALKAFFGRERPDIVIHLVQTSSASFPSGHAMLSAVTYLTLGTLLSRQMTSRSSQALVLGSAVLMTGLVGLSRVYLGVHYPTDVLGGWCAGAAWAAACFLVADLVHPQTKR